MKVELTEYALRTTFDILLNLPFVVACSCLAIFELKVNDMYISICVSIMMVLFKAIVRCLPLHSSSHKCYIIKRTGPLIDTCMLSFMYMYVYGRFYRQMTGKIILLMLCF